MPEKENKVYRGKAGFQRLKVERFGLQRKIVANMTTESWEAIPHAAVSYEPDVTEFWNTFQTLRKQPGWEGITINTVLLYAVAQGLIACPAMNGHIMYKRRSTNGTIELYADINISMPMQLPGGGMMTINIHNCEEKSLAQLRDYITDIRRRMEKTNLTEAMYEAALDNTLRLIKAGKIPIVLARLLGANFGKGKIHRIKGQAKKEYLSIPREDRLTKEDIEPGTITVSNLGSVYRGSYSPCQMLEIIPPQLSALGISGFADRPGVVTGPDGKQEIAIRKYLPICIAFDHRALDYGDVVPFCNRLDEIFADPSGMHNWL